MTLIEAAKQAREAFEWNFNTDLDNIPACERWAKMLKENINALDKAIAKAEQQNPVAMKFKIYKPTTPDPTRQDINNALLPWVYDQDRSSGFDASMWVTPVATLPPQRKPLTDEQIMEMYNEPRSDAEMITFARAIEAAHGITGETK